MLVNRNMSRLVPEASVTLRLTPPIPMPESFLKRFPELRDWQAQNLEVWKKNVEEIGNQISLAAKQQP